MKLLLQYSFRRYAGTGHNYDFLSNLRGQRSQIVVSTTFLGLIKKGFNKKKPAVVKNSVLLYDETINIWEEI